MTKNYTTFFKKGPNKKPKIKNIKVIVPSQNWRIYGSSQRKYLNLTST